MLDGQASIASRLPVRASARLCREGLVVARGFSFTSCGSTRLPKDDGDAPSSGSTSRAARTRSEGRWVARRLEMSDAKKRSRDRGRARGAGLRRPEAPDDRFTIMGSQPRAGDEAGSRCRRSEACCWPPWQAPSSRLNAEARALPPILDACDHAAIPTPPCGLLADFEWKIARRRGPGSAVVHRRAGAWRHTSGSAGPILLIAADREPLAIAPGTPAILCARARRGTRPLPSARPFRLGWGKTDGLSPSRCVLPRD